VVGQAKVQVVRDAKRFEAEGGADGALVYDNALVPVVEDVFTRHFNGGNVRGTTCRRGTGPPGALVLMAPQPTSATPRQAQGPRRNQMERPARGPAVTGEDLLTVPPGGITLAGVRFNVQIGLRFVEAWLRGVGGPRAAVGGPVRTCLTRVDVCVAWLVWCVTEGLVCVQERGGGLGHGGDLQVAGTCVCVWRVS
jgi:hypothetical protein